MTKPTIILIHGMGNFSSQDDTENNADSFYKEFIFSANKALNCYPDISDASIETMAHIHEIHYNDIFENIRKKMADEGKNISAFLNSINGAGPVTSIPGIITKLSGFEAALNENSFIYTHWMDVLFYKTYLGELVRNRVAEKISRIISDNNSSKNIHIIAHSLGTAVIHDTLHKLYRGDYRENDDIADLSPTTHKIKSLWMVANVSRLANSILAIADPLDSIVRPGNSGMTEFMFNVHHKLDPFTLPRSFKPKNNGQWIPGSTFYRYFHDITTTLITNKNTHSFIQYIQDPEVNFPLFRLIFGINFTEDDKAAAIDCYDDQSLSGAYTELEGTLSEFRPTDSSDISTIIDAAHKLRDFIEA